MKCVSRVREKRECEGKGGGGVKRVLEHGLLRSVIPTRPPIPHKQNSRMRNIVDRK